MKLYGGPVVKWPLEKNVLIHAREKRKRMIFARISICFKEGLSNLSRYIFFKFIHGELSLKAKFIEYIWHGSWTFSLPLCCQFQTKNLSMIILIVNYKNKINISFWYTWKCTVCPPKKYFCVRKIISNLFPPKFDVQFFPDFS